MLAEAGHLLLGELVDACGRSSTRPAVLRWAIRLPRVSSRPSPLPAVPWSRAMKVALSAAQASAPPPQRRRRRCSRRARRRRRPPASRPASRGRRLAVKVPIAAPRRSGTTRLTASSERAGKSSEKAAPIPIAPTIATGRRLPAAPSRTRPTVSTRAAPTAQRAAPIRSGRPPPTSRVTTTVPARTLKTSAPWPIPRSSRLRTMKAETAAKPTTQSAKVPPGPDRLAGDQRPPCLARRRWRRASGSREAITAPSSGAPAAKAQTRL